MGSGSTGELASGWECPAGAGPALLSVGQQGVWRLREVVGAGCLFSVGLALRVDVLDRGALVAALGEVAGRHEVLRSRVAVGEGGQPVQVIDGEVRVVLEDLGIVGGAEEAVVAATGFRDRPFDAGRGPLWRAGLVGLRGGGGVLVVAADRLVCDVQSLPVLARELGLVYEDFAAGRGSRLGPLGVQYRDFVRWQREAIGGESFTSQLGYWRRQLSGVMPLELPRDGVRPARGSMRGASFGFGVSAEVAAQLRVIAARERATLFVVLLAAFQVLLGRHAGQEDVAVGTVAPGRDRPEFEPVIGPFENPVVLRTDLSGDPGFAGLLGRVRDTVADAFANQLVPFGLVAEQVAADGQPLFQVMFTLRAGVMGPGLRRLGARPLRLPHTSAECDLSLEITNPNGQMWGSFRYNTDIFGQPTIQQLAERFTSLLADITASPDKPIKELEILGRPERNKIIFEFNRTQAEYPANRVLHELFELQAAESPRAAALAYHGDNITYADLNTWANEVAYLLRDQGVRPGEIVGVAVERGFGMVAALLGILKSGGAFVALDRALPGERRRRIIADLGIRIIVITPATADRDYSGGRLLVIDDALDHAGATRNPSSRALPRDLAYVISTSGSTGRPKAVGIEHRSAVSFLTWARDTYQDIGLDLALATTSPSFDCILFELFAPLCSGGTVVLADDISEIRGMDPGRGVKLISCGPAAMTEFLRNGSLPASVQTINLAGEAPSAELIERLGREETLKNVFNLYGPSETTTYSTAAPLKAARPAAEPGARPTWRQDVTICSPVPSWRRQLRDSYRPVNIGWPIWNTRIYILDRYQQPVPIGFPGEIYIGGAGVARGYLNMLAETKRAFLRDPFVTDPAARMYRTGDLGCFRADGSIDFLGRRDDQIKVRGLRVEPGEIRSVLMRHEHIADAVVIGMGESADRRLVAYLVPDGRAPGEAELRSLLREELPEFMVPSAFVTLGRLPVTANGKLDRGALPGPAGPAESANEYDPPRTPLERVIADIWVEVLNGPCDVQRVGRLDNFFDVGGHSLLAMRIISRVRAWLSADISVASFFASPTVAGLAALVERAGPVDRVRPARGGQQRVLLSAGQEDVWELRAAVGAGCLFSVGLGLRVGVLDRGALGAALGEIGGRHEVLRSRVVVEGGRPVQVADGAGWVVLEDLGSARGAEEAVVLAAGFRDRPFDAGRGPLWRAGLIGLPGAGSILVLAADRLVCDVRSLQVLVRELGLVYEDFAAGRAARLTPLAGQYRDFVRWQREAAGGELFSSQLGYWRGQLSGLAPLEWPRDGVRPAQETRDGASFDFSVPAKIAAQLRVIAARERVTLFMVLLAAFQVLLGRQAGQEDVAVGTLVPGRDRPEFESLIGLFENTVVLRTDLSGVPGFAGLLARVRETAVGAFSNQAVPFRQVAVQVAAGGPPGRPLGQVMFTLRGGVVRPGLRRLGARPLRLPHTSAECDLSLDITNPNDQLWASFRYNTGIFSRPTIQRLAQRFTSLLADITASPRKPIDELSEDLNG